MIFDDILVLLLAPILLAVEAILVPLVNLFILIIELTVRLFISGFQIKRLERRRWKNRKEGFGLSDYISAGFIILFISAFLISGPILNREIQFIASDGHSIPYAEVVLTKNQHKKNLRTDMEGKITISRFGTNQVEIIDPRYVSKIWQEEEISDRLIVERSKVGNAIEHLTKKIMDRLK